MRFRTVTSPHSAGGNDVTKVMAQVLAALVPGTAVATWLLGWGVLVNLLVALVTAVVCEAAMLAARGRPVRPALADLSAPVTGWTLALCLPPLVPFWVTVVAVAFAIVVAKHLYGGLGYNPFNPAMAGFSVVLISFPREVSLWPPAAMIAERPFDLVESMRTIFTGGLPAGLSWDALSMATPLDHVKTGVGLHRPLSAILAEPGFGFVAGTAGEWVALGWLAGGLFLVVRRVVDWRIPFSMLTALFVMAGIFHLVDPERYASPLFHLFSGAAMLGAFFIASDPVTAASTVRGRLIYGACIGLLVWLIRTFGGYPDGVAFAVLLMNLAAPTIDIYTQPRVFGQRRKGGG